MKRFSIIYGSAESGIQKKALAVLSELLLDYTFCYPTCFKWDEEISCEDRICIYIGTKENNPVILENSKVNLTHSEEYSIQVKNGRVFIEGFDDAGVLYGCMDFYNKYILMLEYPHDTVTFAVDPFKNKLPDFEYTSYPSVKNRGIWTWGHVIYDYKSFLDNMVKLKLNTIVIWNDYAPLNARDIIEYAHGCGIKVIWGYAWGWTDGCNTESFDEIYSQIDSIVEKYEREYSKLGGDGIYFQSVTELSRDTIGGKIIAEAVTDFVNQTANKLYEKHPDLELQFGLHATSVKNRLEFIKNVDPRIRIVWENCGSFPFSYIPKNVEDFEDTKEYVKKIAVLRGNNDKFGVVTKGIVKLDWSTFEYMDGPANIGVSSKAVKANRVTRKNKVWKYIQAYWLSYADKAYEMTKAMCEAKNGDLYMTPLVEDGMFEENIMFPAALMSEMMWDTNYDIHKMMTEVALRNYVDFA